MSVIKSRYFQNKEYSSKEALFTDFRKNINSIIDFKKAEIHKSCEKGIAITCRSLDAISIQDQIKSIKFDSAYYYVAVNSTLVLDSHEDLHVDGLWAKSISEQQGKNYLVADHELKIDSVIVKKEYIEMFTAKIPFALLGKPYEGDTEVLVYKFPKDKVVHPRAKEWLESGDEIEASVRMQYVTILFAMDSNDPEDKTLKKNYDEFFPLIANKEEFEYIPYYFIIKEAKNVRESSLVVFGSNGSTGPIFADPSKDSPEEKTIENDPAQTSQQITKGSSLLLL